MNEEKYFIVRKPKGGGDRGYYTRLNSGESGFVSEIYYGNTFPLKEAEFLAGRHRSLADDYDYFVVGYDDAFKKSVADE